MYYCINNGERNMFSVYWNGEDRPLYMYSSEERTLFTDGLEVLMEV